MENKSSSIEQDIRSSFGKLASQLGGDKQTIEKWTESLLTRYSESQRRYHTTTHIHSMLNCLTMSQSLVNNSTAIQLFIFFHDWVYDPQRHDNELQSIAIFEDFAREVNISEDIRNTVSHYIEATITHTMNYQDDTDLKLCLDYDLEVLGRDSAQYRLYASQIRDEYSEFSEQKYASGRIAVLEKFLARDRLFFTEFYKELEECARENLRGEITDLQAKLA
ncbi:hypothetical protein EG329_000309 [Mollisiaceae sp. DMI_Dod_QoI]|nr:hypothetical protein EG329_000309 [Helotiales sp. DMI_Dod_QoI]